jgi:hypothetical protein
VIVYVVVSLEDPTAEYKLEQTFYSRANAERYCDQLNSEKPDDHRGFIVEARKSQSFATDQ